MVIFRENHKNDNRDEFTDFYEFTLSMNFANFLKFAFRYLRENFKKSFTGWIRKNPEIYSSYLFLISLKMTI